MYPKLLLHQQRREAGLRAKGSEREAGTQPREEAAHLPPPSEQLR